MADEQDGQNEEGEFGDYDSNDPNDGNDNGETADVAGTTAVVPQPPPPPPVDGEGGNSVVEDYPEDDEPLPDFHVKLIINDQPDGYATDIATAAITDEFGNPITTTPTWGDSIDGYTKAITQGIQDELTGNQTTVGGKGFFGDWNWQKGLVVGLIALCIIGIIIAVIFIIIKKIKGPSNSETTQGSGSSKKKKEKGVTQDPKYSAVPTNV